MLQLARAFRDAGHDVLWATAAQATPLVTAAGIEAVAAGAHGAEEAALREPCGPGRRSCPGDQRARFVFPRMFGEALTPPMAADLVPLARDWGPDLLVHEHAELAAPLVGALSARSRASPTRSAPPCRCRSSTTPGERLAGLWRAHGLEVPPYAGCFRAGYLDICPPSVQTTSVDHIERVQPLRPVTVSGSTPMRPPNRSSTSRWARCRTRPDLLREVVAGVAGLPSPGARGARAPDRAGSLGEQPAHVQVERGSTRTRVLDRCTAVVSHGGSGTFLGALARGLPQLCLPQAADQFRNAEGGVRAGAALALAPAETTSASVRTAVETLLADSGLRTRRRAGGRRDRGDARAGRGRTAARVESATSTTTRGGESHFRCHRRRRAARRKARAWNPPRPLTSPLTTAPVSRSTSTAPAHRCSACPAGRCSIPATSATSAGSRRTGPSPASTCAGPAPPDTPADPASYRCDRQVADVEAVRRHLGLDRLDLLAHSAGANLAYAYVEHAPRPRRAAGARGAEHPRPGHRDHRRGQVGDRAAARGRAVVRRRRGRARADPGGHRRRARLGRDLAVHVRPLGRRRPRLRRLDGRAPRRREGDGVRSRTAPSTPSPPGPRSRGCDVPVAGARRRAATPATRCR